MRPFRSTDFPEVKNQCIPRKSPLNKASVSLWMGGMVPRRLQGVTAKLEEKRRRKRRRKRKRKRRRFRANSCSYLKKSELPKGAGRGFLDVSRQGNSPPVSQGSSTATNRSLMEAQRGLCGKGKSRECEPDPAAGSRGASGSHFQPALSKHNFARCVLPRSRSRERADPRGNPGQNNPQKYSR